MSDPYVDITDDQIAALRQEAGAAGDVEQVRLCEVAVDPTADAVTRTTARAECARVVAEARAQQPGHLWEWAEDTCQVCGAHIGAGVRWMHLGLCDTCAKAPRH